MMNQRKGSTLVELVMCISAGSTLMLLAIGLVHQTLTLASRGSQRADQARSLARLASQFRSDAHRATDARADSKAELRMSWADESEVVYWAANHRITREHKLASGDVEKESFALDEHVQAAFTSLDEPARAGLLVQRRTGLHDIAPRTELHIVAAVSSLQRAEQGRAQESEQRDEADDQEARP